MCYSGTVKMTIPICQMKKSTGKLESPEAFGTVDIYQILM